MPVIGFLSSESPALFADLMDTFHQGLREVGYIEGQNVVIEYGWAEGKSLSGTYDNPRLWGMWSGAGIGENT